MLPDSYQFDLPWSVDWAPIALFALIAWAALLTYHEAERHSGQKTRPTMRLEHVVARIVGSSRLFKGENPARTMNAFYYIREKAHLGHLDVWGREYIYHSVLQENEPLTLIPRDYWKDHNFAYLEFLRDSKGESEKWKPDASDLVYRDFWFDARQVKREISSVGWRTKISRWREIGI